jgi:hypothetical protein
MNRPLIWFGLVCMILPAFIGIISVVDIAHGQTSPQQSAPYSNQFPQPNQNPFPNQQQGQQQQQRQQQPQPQQGPFLPQQQQQQPQYPPQLQQQFQSPPQQQQPSAGFGVLMNESKVMNCLHSVLSSSIDKVFNHAAGLNEATFMNNATSTLDSCILPRG